MAVSLVEELSRTNQRFAMCGRLGQEVVVSVGTATHWLAHLGASWQRHNRGACLRGLNLTTSVPEIRSHDDRNQTKGHTKFTCYVRRPLAVHSHRIKEPLNECVVCGMQDDAGPQATGFEAHPRPYKTD